jgi:hypothetical protein
MHKLTGLILMAMAVVGFGWWYLFIGWGLLELGAWFDDK